MVLGLEVLTVVETADFGGTLPLAHNGGRALGVAATVEVTDIGGQVASTGPKLIVAFEEIGFEGEVDLRLELSGAYVGGDDEGGRSKRKEGEEKRGEHLYLNLNAAIFNPTKQVSPWEEGLLHTQRSHSRP